MIYSFHINAPPYYAEACLSAFNFAKTALELGHQVYQVFFYGSGVIVGNAATTLPQNETNLTHAWQELACKHQFELLLCSASVQRYGVTKAEHFQIAGLGQLVHAALQSDRLLQFG